jgi:hypothetical protein
MGIVRRVGIRPTVPTLRLRSGQAPLAKGRREGWGTHKLRLMVTLKGRATRPVSLLWNWRFPFICAPQIWFCAEHRVGTLRRAELLRLLLARQA